MHRSLLPLLVVCLASCVVPDPPDITPPLLLGQRLTGPGVFEIAWSEPIQGAAAFEGRSVAFRSDGARVHLDLPKNLVPGQLYRWSVAVTDASGNTTSVRGAFRGPNERPAQLQFNEVRFAGNREHGDAVEFLAVQAGNLGGLVLTMWEGNKEGPSFVFPAREVARGQLLVVRFHSKNAVPAPVWDFPQDRGLSATLGLLVLRSASESPPTQWFVWAKRPGEGLALSRKVGVPVVSTDERGVVGCTPTRTWSRQTDGQWIITATGEATLGAPNSFKKWVPRPSSPTSPRTPKTIAP